MINLKDDEDRIFLGGAGGSTTSPSPIAEKSPLDELTLLKQQSDEASNKRLGINTMGALGDILGSSNSFGNYFTGKLNAPSTAVSKFTDKVAGGVEDPMERSQKAMAYVKSQRDAKISSDEADPNSADSVAMAEQISGVFPQYAQFVKGKSKAQIKEMMPILSKKIEGDTSRENARIAAGQRASDRRDAFEMKEDAKREAAELKNKQSLNEVEDRRRNIEDNLDLVEKMIKDKGTYEMFGSHNNDLDRRIDAIATDMAKLADPNSVARPSEVEQFRKGLFRASATDMKNSTALDIIKNFRNEVGSRTANAYKIRGVENPGTQAQRGSGPQVDPEAEQYAKMHNVTYDQALAVKNARTRNIGTR